MPFALWSTHVPDDVDSVAGDAQQLPDYGIAVERAARRALAEALPLDVAVGAVEFIGGPLARMPRRVGKELNDPLDGIYSARVMREWRVLYEVDEQSRTVTVLAIRHRADAYRSRP